MMNMVEGIEPIVSIVIATRNRSGSLRDMVHSISFQSNVFYEIILVNDYSDDNTMEVLLDLQKEYNNIVIINNKVNIGLAKSLDIAILKSRGKYIARIDDHDSWVRNDKLSLQVQFLNDNQEFALVGTGYKLDNEITFNPESDGEIRSQMLYRCPICHVSVLFRKDVYLNVGGYNSHIKYGEDWDLWLKIGVNYKMRNLSIMAVDVSSEGGMSSKAFKSQNKLGLQMVKKYGAFYPGARKAWLYHNFVRIFFSIIKVDSFLHLKMKKVFNYTFTKS